MEDKIKDMLEVIGKGKATIKIKKDTGLTIEANGSRLALLFALASSEKSLLKKLNCDSEEFDVIKKICNIIGELNE